MSEGTSKEEGDRPTGRSQPSSRHPSRIAMLRQCSKTTVRSNYEHHPLHRHHSSLADIAREHKQQLRNSASTNNIRKFYSSSDTADADLDYEEEVSDEFVLLRNHLSRAHHPQSPANPHFLYRTGSRVLSQAELELGESRHNSPSASVPHSLSASREVSSDDDDDGVHRGRGSISSGAESERMFSLQLESATESDSDLASFNDDDEDDDDYDGSAYSEDLLATTQTRLWNFLVQDVLGFPTHRPRNAGAKQRRRERTTGVFDPALALGLIAAFLR